MSRFLAGVAAGAVMCALAGGAFAAELPGKYEGVTIDAKLIGGQQYEGLYARIAEWEKATGAKVNILSKKNHFELDKEIKSDIATGNITWCVGSNHSSFAPQYPDIYTDLSKLLPKEEIDAFVPANIKSSTLGGKLVMLPRAQFDVSALYYQKSLYQDEAKKAAFKEKYGYELTPPDTWQQVADQAAFFAKPPEFYGTQFAGKEECWSLKAASISMQTASLPSTRKLAFARSTGSSISTRRRLFLRVRRTTSGTTSARALRPAPSRSTSIGRVGQASSTIRSLRRLPAMSA